MGMAAPQSRFLCLTARQNSIELQLGRLANEKTSLARDMSKVSKKYNDALQKKVLKWSDNSGRTYSTLSYNSIMTPNAANNNTPYYITDNNGKVVLDAQMAKFARTLSPSGKAGVPYEGQARYDALAAATGFDANKIQKYEEACDNVKDKRNQMMYWEGLSKFYQEKADECVTYYDLTGSTSSTASYAARVFGTGTDGLYRNTGDITTINVTISQYNYSDGKTHYYSWELTTSGDDKGKRIEFTDITVSYWDWGSWSMTEDVKSTAEGLYNAAVETAKGKLDSFKNKMYMQLNEYFAGASYAGSTEKIDKNTGTQIEKNMTYAEYSAMYDAIKTTSIQELQACTQKCSYDGGEYGNTFVDNEVIDIVMSKFERMICADSWAGVDLKSMDEDEFILEGDAGIKVAYRANTKVNGVSMDWTSIMKLKEEADAQLKSGNNTVYDQYTQAVDDRNNIFSADELTQINFYDKVFSSICENGWIENNEVKDDDYLNNMLQNNMYYITTQTLHEGEETYTSFHEIGYSGITGKRTGSSSGRYDNLYKNDPNALNDYAMKNYEFKADEYSYTTDLASNNAKIYTVKDDDAATEAETQYLYEKAIINAKETRIDTRMQKLETENSAISQRLKALQSMINENTERLNIFNA